MTDSFRAFRARVARLEAEPRFQPYVMPPQLRATVEGIIRCAREHPEKWPGLAEDLRRADAEKAARAAAEAEP